MSNQNSNQQLELARHLGTKPEFMVIVDWAAYQAKDPKLANVLDVVKQFKSDIADWLTANNEWGNLHVVSELPHMATILISCDHAVATKFETTMFGISQVQEWIEK